jgi:hypothetical protein
VKLPKKLLQLIIFITTLSKPKCITESRFGATASKALLTRVEKYFQQREKSDA